MRTNSNECGKPDSNSGENEEMIADQASYAIAIAKWEDEGGKVSKEEED